MDPRLTNKVINIWWNKYYGYDEKYPDEDNYRVISADIFGRSCTLICVWKKLSFYLTVSENLRTHWEPLDGPPKRKLYKLRILS